MSAFVVCNCPGGHRPHQFTAGAFDLCTVCGHGVSAHKDSKKDSAEVADRVTRLLRTHEVDDFSVSINPDGSLELSMKLTKPQLQGSGR